MSDFYTDFARLFEENGLGGFVSRETSEKFELLAQKLEETNEKFNLTAITDREGIIIKHFADSVFPSGQLAEGANVIDVGAGAGFPSLPLAVVRPDLRITSLDSTAKKLGFVAEAARELGLNNVTTLISRAEDAGRSAEHREKYDAVISRAVAALPVLSELCLPLVKKKGLFIAMKGPSAFDEAKEAESVITLLGGDKAAFADYTLKNGGAKENRILVLVTKKQFTPTKYPRNYSQIAKAAKKAK